MPVLVILDDLDRLEPNELLLTFKLVRLLGRLPNVYYLLSYDEATLESVLRRTDLVGDEAGRARDYLEKMVQVRLDVPPLLDEHRVALVNECLSDCLQRHHLELDDDANTRLQQAWHNCLRHYLDQPRAVRKLFSQVDLLWPEVEEEVDFVDFLLVTFLRTFERAVHELVLDRREELVGTLADWSLSRRQESHAERWQRWMELMRTAGASRPEAVGLLLAELFLPIRSARENMAYGSSYAADIRHRKGVGSDEFFNRYTQMGVVAKDVSDRLVLRALDEMARGVHGDAVATLEQKLAEDARLVTAKLDRLVDRAELPAAALLGLLARHYVASRQQATGPFGMSADFGILLLSLRLLNRLGGAEATAALRELTRTAAGLALAADAMQKATFAEETNHGPWVTDGRGSVVEALEAGILDASKTPLAETERVVIRWLYALRHLAAEGQARQLVWTILDDDGPWTLEDLLAALVPVGSTSDGRSSWESLGELDSGGVDELLGLDRALGALQLPEDAAAVSTEPFERRRLPVTFEMRRQYALAVMARLKANRGATPDAAEE